MALIRLDIYQLLNFLQTCGTFTCTWPLEPTAKTREIVFYELRWMLLVLNTMTVIPALIFGAFFHRDDLVRVMKIVSVLMAVVEMFFSLILCKIGRSELQVLIVKLKDFLKRSEPHEMRIIQKYIDRYSGFCAYIVMSHVVAVITFCFGPVFLPLDLPMEGWYPFPIDAFYIKAILYASQSLAIIQAGVCITVDFKIAMFFWFSSARMEMLAEEFQRVTQVKQIRICIRKHQEIISFVDYVQSTVQHLIFKTNLTMASILICGAFPLIRKQPLGVTAQFILCIVLAACQRLYIITWPADDMAEMSENIGWQAYGMKWYETPREVVSSLSIFVQRTRKPLQISMGNIFPVLSLEYYVNFLKATSSYFMTMRALIVEEDENDA